MSSDVAALLQRWRAAERRLQGTADDLDREGLTQDVIQTWLAYHAAAAAAGSAEIILVTDRQRRYVAATDNAATLFGGDPVGASIDDVATQGPDELDRTWDAFASHGSMEGEYEIRDSAGSIVRVRFQAFADVPLPGFFVSHLTPVASESETGFPNSVDPVQRGRTLVATLREQTR